MSGYLLDGDAVKQLSALLKRGGDPSRAEPPYQDSWPRIQPCRVTTVVTPMDGTGDALQVGKGEVVLLRSVEDGSDTLLKKVADESDLVFPVYNATRSNAEVGAAGIVLEDFWGALWFFHTEHTAIAFTTGGVTARSGATTGTGTAVIKKINPSGGIVDFDPVRTVNVRNVSSTAVGANKYIQLKRDSFSGLWIVDWEQC